MKIGGIIQARLETDAERLILHKINGEIVIAHAIKRIKNLKSIDSIIFAMPEGTPKELEDIAKTFGLRIFIGPDNPLDRLIEAAKSEQLDSVVRFAPNTPLLDRELSDKLIKLHMEKDSDYTYGDGFPLGVLPEIINLKTLLHVRDDGRHDSYQGYIMDNRRDLKVSFLKSGLGLDGLKLNINHPSDISIAKNVFETTNAQAGFHETIKALPKAIVSVMSAVTEKAEKKRLNRSINITEAALQSDTLLSMPPHLRIDPHNLCNIECKTCIQSFKSLTNEEFNNVFGSFPTSNVENLEIFVKKDNGWVKKPVALDEERFAKIREELFPTLESVSFGDYGEPFLNKEFTKFLKACKDEKLHTHILTNGTLFKDESIRQLVDLGIDAVTISFDGATREVFEEIRRGADYSAVVSSIKKISALKQELGASSPSIELQFTASAENIEELPALIENAPDIGVESVSVINRYISDFMDPAQSLWHFREKGANLLLEAGESAISAEIDLSLSPLLEFFLFGKEKEGNCDWPWNMVFISSGGDAHLCPCMGMRSAGNIVEKPFSQIWNGDDFKKLRGGLAGLAGNDELFDECRNCVVGMTLTGKPNISSFLCGAHTGG